MADDIFEAAHEQVTKAVEQHRETVRLRNELRAKQKPKRLKAVHDAAKVAGEAAAKTNKATARSAVASEVVTEAANPKPKPKPKKGSEG